MAFQSYCILSPESGRWFLWAAMQSITPSLWATVSYICTRIIVNLPFFPMKCIKISSTNLSKFKTVAARRKNSWQGYECKIWLIWLKKCTKGNHVQDDYSNSFNSRRGPTPSWPPLPVFLFKSHLALILWLT